VLPTSGAEHQSVDQSNHRSPETSAAAVNVLIDTPYIWRST
jgi:hypothetical protein